MEPKTLLAQLNACFTLHRVRTRTEPRRPDVVGMFEMPVAHPHSIQPRNRQPRTTKCDERRIDHHDGERRHHDRVAAYYDAVYVDRLPYRLLGREICETLRRYCDLARTRWVLDLGAGTGSLTLPLASAYRNIVGVDLSSAMLARLATKCARRTDIHTVQAAGEALPFADARFDLVTVAKVLHHLDDMDPVLWELRRVLRCGGYLCVIEDHAPRLLSDSLRELVRQRFVPARYPDGTPTRTAEEHAFDHRAFIRALRAHRFEALTHWATFHFPIDAPEGTRRAHLIEQLWTVPQYLPLIRHWGAVVVIIARAGK